MVDTLQLCYKINNIFQSIMLMKKKQTYENVKILPISYYIKA